MLGLAVDELETLEDCFATLSIPYTTLLMVHVAKLKPFVDVTKVNPLLDFPAQYAVNFLIKGGTGRYRSKYRTLLPENSQNQLYALRTRWREMVL